MAANDTPPRFFKVFISRFSSDSMLIPISYYDELPSILPKTVILQGTGGCLWNVEMKKKRDEVYFGQGWLKFVTDNSLTDGDFLTFVYDGDRIFEVSIYALHTCKVTRAVAEVEDVEEDRLWSVSSKETDTCSESDMAITVPRSKNKGKSKVEVVEESDDEEDSVYTDTDTDTCSEFKLAKTIPRSRNKGKKKEKVVESSNEDSDSSDYIDEAFDRLDVEENSNSDSSYAPDCEEDTTTAIVKPKVKNPKKKGKSKSTEDVDATSESSDSVEPPKQKRERVKSKRIKDPEKYLDDPNNVYFETSVKNRKFELLVRGQLVKDYFLKFRDYVYYIDNHKDGTLEAETAIWKDQRVCIKGWTRICKRNQLKKGDGILCELLREGGFVYAIKIHIIREKDM